MGRAANLSSEKCAQIVALSESGFSQRRITHQLKCSQNAVPLAVRRYRQTGSNTDRPHSGRPCVSKACEVAYIALIARRQRRITVR